jgi:hypothetical protein
LRKSGALTYRIPKGLLRPVAGKLYLLLLCSTTAEFKSPISIMTITGFYRRCNDNGLEKM